MEYSITPHPFAALLSVIIHQYNSAISLKFGLDQQNQQKLANIWQEMAADSLNHVVTPEALLQSRNTKSSTLPWIVFENGKMISSSSTTEDSNSTEPDNVENNADRF